MSIRFPLPPMVLKLPENWSNQLKNTIIDFSFYIEIIRSSILSDDCSITQSNFARYICKATPLVKFSKDTTLIGFDVIHKNFSNIPTREMMRISLKLLGPAEDYNLLMRLLREMYLATLSGRLNDVSDDFANPASQTVEINLLFYINGKLLTCAITLTTLLQITWIV